MRTEITTSYPVSIFIAGRASDIEDQCRSYCDEVGLCVTCTPTTFVYTGGEEAGYIVGLINYPRFPSEPESIWARAEDLAKRLRLEAAQESFTIQAPDKTVWYSWREADLALAAATGTAKTPQAAECEASQSGPKGNAHTSPPSSPSPIKE